MRADVTIGALRVSRTEARQFGVMQTDGADRVTGFQEKPDDPIGLAEDPEVCLASMGIYVFNATFLYEQLCDDATSEDSDHDFGKNIIPGAIKDYQVCAFPFLDENRKGDAYWRDVGYHARRHGRFAPESAVGCAVAELAGRRAVLQR